MHGGNDTTVYDEPFYAHYLSLTARDHPMFDEVVAAQSTDVSEVIDEVILGPIDTPVYFMKQMAHHLHGVPRGASPHQNILPTRDPRHAQSLSVQLPDCGLADTGLIEQVEYLDAVLNDGGSRGDRFPPPARRSRRRSCTGLRSTRPRVRRSDAVMAGRPNPKTASGRPPGMRRCTPRRFFAYRPSSHPIDWA